MENKKNNSQFSQGIIIGFVCVLLVILAFFFGFKLGKEYFNGLRGYPPLFYPFIKPPKYGYVPKKIFGHGMVGTIDSLGKESFVLKNRWGELITVLVDKNTKYKIDGKDGFFSDIKKGKQVIVLGEPDNSQLVIKAKIIRIF